MIVGTGDRSVSRLRNFFLNICQKSVSDSSGDKQCNNLSMALRHAA